jgi:hypothetical protein
MPSTHGTPTPASPPGSVVIDLDRVDTTSAFVLDDGRVSIELDEAGVTLVGSLAAMLDHGASVTSHAHSVTRERVR